MLVTGHDGPQKTGDSAVGEADHPAAAQGLRQLVETTLIPMVCGYVNVGRHIHHGATAGAFPNVRIWHISSAVLSLFALGG
jgi:hypothetical protein